MNFHELSFKDIGYLLAGFNLDTMAIHLNANEDFTLSEYASEKTEECCSEIMTHETLHGVLYQVAGEKAFHAIDRIDKWFNNFQISKFTRETHEET